MEVSDDNKLRHMSVNDTVSDIIKQLNELIEKFKARKKIRSKIRSITHEKRTITKTTKTSYSSDDNMSMNTYVAQDKL